MVNNGIKYNKNESTYFGLTNDLINFIKDFYDDREETDKDIWYSKNIKGAKVNATSDRTAVSLNFVEIPSYYKEITKRYFRTIITKKKLGSLFSNFKQIKVLL